MRVIFIRIYGRTELQYIIETDLSWFVLKCVWEFVLILLKISTGHIQTIQLFVISYSHESNSASGMIFTRCLHYPLSDRSVSVPNCTGTVKTAWSTCALHKLTFGPARLITETKLSSSVTLILIWYQRALLPQVVWTIPSWVVLFTNSLACQALGTHLRNS